MSFIRKVAAYNGWQGDQPGTRHAGSKMVKSTTPSGKHPTGLGLQNQLVFSFVIRYGDCPSGLASDQNRPRHPGCDRRHNHQDCALPSGEPD